MLRSRATGASSQVSLRKWSSCLSPESRSDPTFQPGMSQGSRPERVADQIRSELATLLVRDVHDPGIGFVTLTRVQLSPDLQQARVHYTTLGDDKARITTA